MLSISGSLVFILGFGFVACQQSDNCVKSNIPQSLLSILDECRSQNIKEFQRIWNQCVRSAMLDLDFTKQNPSAVMSTVLACEGNSLNLACGVGTKVRIFEANYGRTEGKSVCDNANIHTTDCREANSKAIAMGMCKNVQACTIPATNEVFGDPCANTYKYLNVSFYCS